MCKFYKTNKKANSQMILQRNFFENIKNRCEERLVEIYPKKIPKLVLSRYHRELDCLENSNCMENIEEFLLLNCEAKERGQFLFPTGTLRGSYIAYLLGNSLVNPLPAHYYCTQCGHFEKVGTALLGIDLPRAVCPKCGTTMTSDGFNISLESFWGVGESPNLNCEYRISEEFFPYAQNVLETVYPEYQVLPLGIVYDIGENKTLKQSGFLIIPDGKNIEDCKLNCEYLENGRKCVIRDCTVDYAKYGIKYIRMFASEVGNKIIDMQKSTGIPITNISLKDLRSIIWQDIVNTNELDDREANMFQKVKPETYTEMLIFLACSHDSFKSINRNLPNQADKLLKLIIRPEFAIIPFFTSDDIFNAVVAMGVDRANAYKISKAVGIGKITSNLSLLGQYDFPYSFLKLVLECDYLFPKAHCAELLLMYAILAFYEKQLSNKE